MKKDIKWLFPRLACIVASVASTFLPVLTYVYPSGRKIAFNVVSIANQSQDLLDILLTYQGYIPFYIDFAWLTVLAILAVLAIGLAFIGVITMSSQKPNTFQFAMTLVGLIGTAIPAIIVIAAVPVSHMYLPGLFHLGVYPIVTPIAMIFCMISVTKKHKRTREELKVEERAKGLIRPAGDL